MRVAHTNAITSAQFDRSKIVTSSFDRTVKVWNFALKGAK